MKKLLFLVLVAVAVVACDKDDNGRKPFVLPGAWQSYAQMGGTLNGESFNMVDTGNVSRNLSSATFYTKENAETPPFSWTLRDTTHVGKDYVFYVNVCKGQNSTHTITQGYADAHPSTQPAHLSDGFLLEVRDNANGATVSYVPTEDSPLSCTVDRMERVTYSSESGQSSVISLKYYVVGEVHGTLVNRDDPKDLMEVHAKYTLLMPAS